VSNRIFIHPANDQGQSFAIEKGTSSSVSSPAPPTTFPVRSFVVYRSERLAQRSSIELEASMKQCGYPLALPQSLVDVRA
jgi:hypothetical protein